MVARYLTTEKEQGLRLDQFLQQRVPTLSRTKIRKIIDLGGVHIDGQRVRRCSWNVEPNQKIELYQDNSPLDPFRLSQDTILFQDKYLIVINKPAGVDTQPTPARYKGTLYEALLAWFEKDKKIRHPQIGMAQRLDRDTSGVIVFSTHPDAHKELTTQIQNHTVKKEYLAMVQGIPSPDEGTFHSFLKKDPTSHRMYSDPSKGKEAITHYRTVKSWADSALVSIQLVTGRTHQIRTHFSEAGYPLLGDVQYGGPRIHGGCKWSRQCLHSWKLQMNHPKTGESLSFAAPIPADMGAAL
jgi:23S rRNA pseudouridine1911/1915/1917 synthase